MPHLILLLATPVGEKSRSYTLDKREITIGREEEADIQIFDQGASRLHARVSSEKDHFLLSDLKTKNGTYVNGIRIKEHLLQDGDIITIGRSQFIYTEKEWVEFVEQDLLEDYGGQETSKFPTEILSVEALANEIASLTQKFSLLYWMSRIIQEETEVPLFLKKSLICLVDGIKARRGSIYLYFPQGLEKVSETTIGDPIVTPYPKEKKIILQTYSQGRGMVLKEKVDKTFYTLICVPLKVRQKITGILYLESLGKKIYTEEDLRFLNIAANIFAVNAENRRLIQNLRKTQKNLEEHSAFGEILSCIAHELKNPITTASGYLELLGRKEEDPQNQRRLESIERELSRSVNIIENMLSFAKKREPNLAQEDLNGVIRAALQRKKKSSSGQIAFEEDLSQEDLNADVDGLQMEQVFLNLLNNAEESILQLGQEGTIRVKSWKVGNNIFVSIQDSGGGIPPEEESKIFKPFFTTKERGTGLGLSLCQHIVRAHWGDLSIRNAEDGGVIVRVQLPAFRE